jgi:(1->4)-alpha-D-glucan 1-alpha-D-glucosylmutase
LARGGVVAVVVPRLVATLVGGPDPGLSSLPAGPNPARGAWGDTAVTLPSGRWVDVITGAPWQGNGDIAVGQLLERFPVALLERSDA